MDKCANVIVSNFVLIPEAPLVAWFNHWSECLKHSLVIAKWICEWTGQHEPYCRRKTVNKRTSVKLLPVNGPKWIGTTKSPKLPMMLSDGHTGIGPIDASLWCSWLVSLDVIIGQTMMVVRSLHQLGQPSHDEWLEMTRRGNRAQRGEHMIVAMNQATMRWRWERATGERMSSPSTFPSLPFIRKTPWRP